MDSPAGKAAKAGILASLALIFSYVEVLIPFQPGLPGVKLGLANLVVVMALYRMNERFALLVNFVRVLLAGLLFTGLFGFFYSLAGCLLSFAVMVLLKRTGKFSVIGVSMAGGAAHNLGQLAVALAVVSNIRLVSYYPVLLFSGIATGILIGVVSHLMLQRLPLL